MAKDCILHPNKPNSRGYVPLKVDGRYVNAHRLVLEKKLKRPLRAGYEACHTCDTRNCINEDHLYEGTHSQNMKDAFDRDRAVSGFAHAKRKRDTCDFGHPILQVSRFRRRCRECDKRAAQRRRMIA